MTSLGLLGMVWGLASASDDLAGTRPGPHYAILTKAERADLRDRVRREAWAQTLFERDILPLARMVVQTPPKYYETAQNYVTYAAVAFLVLGQREYLEAALAWVDLEMERYRKVPREKLQAAWGIDYVRTDVGAVYDLVAEALPPDKEQRLRAFIRQALDDARQWHTTHSQNPNMVFHQLSSLGTWACTIGYDAYIDWVLDHENPPGQWCACGLKQLMRDYILDGSLDDEGPYYSIYEIGTMSVFAEAMARYGYRDFYGLEAPGGASLVRMMDGWLALAWPRWQDGMVNVAPSVSAGVVLAGSGPRQGTWEAPWPVGCLERAITTRVRRFREPAWLWVYGRNRSVDRRVFVPIERGWSLVRCFDSSLDDLLYGRVDVPADLKPPAAGSALFPEAGVAMLRSPEGPAYWDKGVAAYLHGGEPWRLSGGVPDLFVFGAGTLFYHDRYDYSDPCTTGWKNRRLSKNTITIDGKDGLFSYSVSRQAFDPEVKYAAFRSWPYLEASMERALMLTDEYLLEVFRAVVDPTDIDPDRFWDYGGSVYWPCNASLQVHPSGYRASYPWPWKWKGSDRNGIVHHPGQPIRLGARLMPREHTFDYTIRSLGELYPDDWSRFQPSTEYTRSYWPLRWLENERRCRTDHTFHVDWVQQAWAGQPHEHQMQGDDVKTSNAGIRLTMLGEPGTLVVLADEPDLRRGLAVRRTGTETCYVAVHEPYRQAPTLRQVRYLQRPGRGQARPSLAVLVAGPDYEDRLYLTLGLEGRRTHRRRRPRQDFRPPIRPESPDPLVVSTTEDDAGEGVAYRGQAYFRRRGEVLVARGQIEAFSLRAASVRQLVLNGRETPFTKVQDRVVYGGNRWPEAAAPERPEAALPMGPPLRAVLVQPLVNLDAAAGGVVQVRVEHPPVNTPTAPAAGRIELACPGLQGEPLSAAVPSLGPGQSTVLAFPLRGGRAGQTYPLRLRLFDEREASIHTLEAEVAVGVVVRIIRQGYDQPMVKDYYDGRTLASDELENFDRLQVRAPGYTIEVDLFSGTSRYVLDPAGRLRTRLGRYPYRFTRGHVFDKGDMADVRRTTWKSYEVPTVWAPDVKGETVNLAKQKKLFGFWVQSRFLGLGRDAGDNPCARFATTDGAYELAYVFRPTEIQVSVERKAAGPDFRLDFSSLDQTDDAFEYRLVVEGTTIRFTKK